MTGKACQSIYYCIHDNQRNACIVPQRLTNRLVKNKAKPQYGCMALSFSSLLVRLCGTVQILLWLSWLLLKMPTITSYFESIKEAFPAIVLCFGNFNSFK